jgi:hypothetical protein
VRSLAKIVVNAVDGWRNQKKADGKCSVSPEASRKVSTHQCDQVTDTQATVMSSMTSCNGMESAKSAPADDQRAE